MAPPQNGNPAETRHDTHAQQLCETLNISHRQLDHWCRKGWLQPDNPNPGTVQA